MLEIRDDAMNNSSMFTADRGTHLKIVVVSIICATVVAGIGIATRVSPPKVGMEATVITVGKPITAAAGDTTSIR
jgi:ABC-type proline/glycine betaine transport system permease subunit